MSMLDMMTSVGLMVEVVRRVKISTHGGFPGDPVVRIPCFHCRGPKFDLWLRI